MENIDVLIIGGGPAGTATGLALGRLGISTIVIDRGDDRPRIGETLPPAIKKLLVSLGIWERFLSANHSPSFGTRARWGQPIPHENNFIFSPYGRGWHLDRVCFDAMLAQAAEDEGTVLYRRAKLVSVVPDVEHSWRVDTVRDNRGHKFRAKVIVDATGRSASLARRLGSQRVSYDRLVGIVGLFVPGARSLIQQQLTLIEACRDGWWYSSLLPDSGVVVAYMTDADLYAKAVRRTRNFWQHELGKTTDIYPRISTHILKSSPVNVAAHSSRLFPVSGPNWLAVGDAAAAFDPLSSQGIYKAVESGLLSAHAIQCYLAGNSAALHDYALAIERGFSHYMRVREHYYSNEQRWPTSTFWTRRRRGDDSHQAIGDRPRL